MEKGLDIWTNRRELSRIWTNSGERLRYLDQQERISVVDPDPEPDPGSGSVLDPYSVGPLDPDPDP